MKDTTPSGIARRMKQTAILETLTTHPDMTYQQVADLHMVSRMTVCNLVKANNISRKFVTVRMGANQ